MAKSRLITTSLVDSIGWLKKCPPSWKLKAYQDLTKMLAREYDDEMPAAVALGIKFEDLVRDVCEGRKQLGGSDFFKQVVDRCNGGVFQQKVKKTLVIGDYEYCLYGKVDVLFPERVVDIKTTHNYKNEAQYLDKFQHKLYCWITEHKHFDYVVAEFKDSPDGTPVLIGVHTVPYHVSDFVALGKEVADKVEEVMHFIADDAKLVALYHEKFCLY